MKLTAAFLEADHDLLRFTYRHVGVSNLKIDPLLLPQLAQSVRVGIAEVNLIQDRRDDPLDPHKGIYNTVERGAGDKAFGSQTSFGRMLARNATYHRIGEKSCWLARRSSACSRRSAIPPTAQASDPIPLAERFFAGGGNTQRGFPENQAGSARFADRISAGRVGLCFSTTRNCGFRYMGRTLTGYSSRTRGTSIRVWGRFRFGLSYWPSLLVAIIVTAVGGLILYELFLSRLQHGAFERSILITLAISIIILHAAQLAFSANPRMVDTQYGFDGFSVGAIRVTWTRVIGAGAAVGAFALLYALLNHTQFGRAMRAISQNREAALMVGIKPRTVARNAVVLATALCGLAGAALAPVQLVTPAMGQALIFKAFALVIIGGLGNIPGAIAAALLLGLIESWVGGFFEIVWQEAAVFIMMIAVLCLRPEGLFKRGAMRVG